MCGCNTNIQHRVRASFCYRVRDSFYHRVGDLLSIMCGRNTYIRMPVYFCSSTEFVTTACVHRIQSWWLTEYHVWMWHISVCLSTCFLAQSSWQENVNLIQSWWLIEHHVWMWHVFNTEFVTHSNTEFVTHSNTELVTHWVSCVDVTNTYIRMSINLFGSTEFVIRVCVHRIQSWWRTEYHVWM